MRLLRRLWRSADFPWLLAVLGFFGLQYRAAVFQGRHWLFGDNAFQNFPWHYFVWDRVRHGGLTAPCREMALGFPLFAEPQAQCFYPLNTALWPIADPLVSFTPKLVLHMLAATVGMYALARWLGRSALGAAAAALVMCGGSFMVYRVVHAPILFSLAWLPWVVLLYLRVLRAEFPDLLWPYRRMLFEAAEREAYVAQLRQRVGDAARRLGLADRVSGCT